MAKQKMAFAKAVRSKAKLRLAIMGPSGGGKTYTALRLAKGIAAAEALTVALIDTENYSASKYAIGNDGEGFDFQALDLEDKSIDGYVEAIGLAAENGFGVLVIDSITHGWQELLAQIDKLAQTKFRGNTWSAWSEGTPKQRQLVQAILNYPGHVIATMRSKTEWTQEVGSNGKTKPVRVGMAPEQGKGIEYEFDFLLEMTTDHIGTFIKSRYSPYQDKIVDKPGEQIGVELAAWLGDAPDAPVKPQAEAVHPMADVDAAKKTIAAALGDRGVNRVGMVATVSEWLKAIGAKDFSASTTDQRDAFLKEIQAGRHDPKKQAEQPAAQEDAQAEPVQPEEAADQASHQVAA